MKCCADEKILYKTLLLLSIFTRAITPVSIFVSVTASHCYSWGRKNSWWRRWCYATDRAIAKYNLSVRCSSFYQSIKRHHCFEKSDSIARFSCVSLVYPLFSHCCSLTMKVIVKKLQGKECVVDVSTVWSICPLFFHTSIFLCNLNFLLYTNNYNYKWG